MTAPSATHGPLTLRYLSRADVEATGVTMEAVIEAVETGFREKGNGRVEMPPKPGVHPGEGDNFIHAMPASIPGLDAVGIKWISGYPGNQALGLPYITRASGRPPHPRCRLAVPGAPGLVGARHPRLRRPGVIPRRCPARRPSRPQDDPGIRS